MTDSALRESVARHEYLQNGEAFEQDDIFSNLQLPTPGSAFRLPLYVLPYSLVIYPHQQVPMSFSQEQINGWKLSLGIGQGIPILTEENKSNWIPQFVSVVNLNSITDTSRITPDIGSIVRVLETRIIVRNGERQYNAIVRGYGRFKNEGYEPGLLHHWQGVVTARMLFDNVGPLQPPWKLLGGYKRDPIPGRKHLPLSKGCLHTSGFAFNMLSSYQLAKRVLRKGRFLLSGVGPSDDEEEKNDLTLDELTWLKVYYETPLDQRAALITRLSFKIAQNLPRLAKGDNLLHIDSVVERLRKEEELLDNLIAIGTFRCTGCSVFVGAVQNLIVVSTAGGAETFVNEYGYMHQVYTVSDAQLSITGEEPSTQFSWFPGYAWTIAYCSSCLQHMGWLFTRSDGNESARQSFWGLSRNSVAVTDSHNT